MNREETPSYWVNIPATVRYDKRLKPIEILLFGELTCLSYKDGYAHPTNSYFAWLYGVNVSTVSRYISNLEKCGYIKTRIIYKENSKEVLERRIYMNYNAEIDTPTGVLQYNQGGIDEISNRGIAEISKENNTRKNNTRYNNMVADSVENKKVVTDVNSISSTANDDSILRSEFVSLPKYPDLLFTREELDKLKEQHGDRAEAILKAMHDWNMQDWVSNKYIVYSDIERFFSMKRNEGKQKLVDIAYHELHKKKKYEGFTLD